MQDITNYRHEIYIALIDWGYSLILFNEDAPNIATFSGDTVSFPDMETISFDSLDALHDLVRARCKDFQSRLSNDYSGTFHRYCMFSEPELVGELWQMKIAFAEIRINNFVNRRVSL